MGSRRVTVPRSPVGMAASGTAMLALLVAACGNPPVLQLVDKELAGDPGNPFVRAMGSFAYWVRPSDIGTQRWLITLAALLLAVALTFALLVAVLAAMEAPARALPVFVAAWACTTLGLAIAGLARGLLLLRFTLDYSRIDTFRLAVPEAATAASLGLLVGWLVAVVTVAGPWSRKPRPVSEAAAADPSPSPSPAPSPSPSRTPSPSVSR